MLAKSNFGLQHGASIRETGGSAEHKKETGVAMPAQTAEILENAPQNAVNSAGSIACHPAYATVGNHSHACCLPIILPCRSP